MSFLQKKVKMTLAMVLTFVMVFSIAPSVSAATGEEIVGYITAKTTPAPTEYYRFKKTELAVASTNPTGAMWSLYQATKPVVAFEVKKLDGSSYIIDAVAMNKTYGNAIAGGSTPSAARNSATSETKTPEVFETTGGAIKNVATTGTPETTASITVAAGGKVTADVSAKSITKVEVLTATTVKVTLDSAPAAPLAITDFTVTKGMTDTGMGSSVTPTAISPDTASQTYTLTVPTLTANEYVKVTNANAKLTGSAVGKYDVTARVEIDSIALPSNSTIAVTMKAAVTDLAATDFVVKKGTTEITGSVLTGTGPAYTLTMPSGTTFANGDVITVEATTNNAKITGSAVGTYAVAARVEIDSIALPTNSTITVTMKAAVTDLAATDFVVKKGTAPITGSVLTGTGPAYTLTMPSGTTFANGDSVTVEATADNAKITGTKSMTYAVTPVGDVSLSSISILNADTIEATLSGAKADLAVANFKVSTAASHTTMAAAEGLVTATPTTVVAKEGSNNTVYVITLSGIAPSSGDYAAVKLVGSETLGLTETVKSARFLAPATPIIDPASTVKEPDIYTAATAINGFTATKSYTVQVKSGSNSGKYLGLTAANTLGIVSSAYYSTPQIIKGITAISSAENGVTYLVNEYTTTEVKLSPSGSIGTKGDSKITGLTGTYQLLIVDGAGFNNGKYVIAANGTSLSATGKDLNFAEVTGLVNGVTYQAGASAVALGTVSQLTTAGSVGDLEIQYTANATSAAWYPKITAIKLTKTGARGVGPMTGIASATIDASKLVTATDKVIVKKADLPAGLDGQYTVSVLATDYVDVTKTGVNIDVVAPVLTKGDVTRTSVAAASIPFTSNEGITGGAGKGYFSKVFTSASDPITTGNGSAVNKDSATTLSATGLSSGPKVCRFIVIDAMGNKTTLDVDVPNPSEGLPADTYTVKSSTANLADKQIQIDASGNVVVYNASGNITYTATTLANFAKIKAVVGQLVDGETFTYSGTAVTDVVVEHNGTADRTVNLGTNIDAAATITATGPNAAGTAKLIVKGTTNGAITVTGGCVDVSDANLTIADIELAADMEDVALIAGEKTVTIAQDNTVNAIRVIGEGVITNASDSARVITIGTGSNLVSIVDDGTLQMDADGAIVDVSTTAGDVTLLSGSYNLKFDTAANISGLILQPTIGSTVTATAKDSAINAEELALIDATDGATVMLDLDGSVTVANSGAATITVNGAIEAIGVVGDGTAIGTITVNSGSTVADLTNAATATLKKLVVIGDLTVGASADLADTLTIAETVINTGANLFLVETTANLEFAKLTVNGTLDVAAGANYAFAATGVTATVGTEGEIKTADTGGFTLAGATTLTVNSAKDITLGTEEGAFALTIAGTGSGDIDLDEVEDAVIISGAGTGKVTLNGDAAAGDAATALTVGGSRPVDLKDALAASPGTLTIQSGYTGQFVEVGATSLVDKAAATVGAKCIIAGAPGTGGSITLIVATTDKITYTGCTTTQSAAVAGVIGFTASFSVITLADASANAGGLTSTTFTTTGAVSTVTAKLAGTTLSEIMISN